MSVGFIECGECGVSFFVIVRLVWVFGLFVYDFMLIVE